jgi:hypothetical protein
MRKSGFQVVVHAAVLGLYWVAMNTALGAPPSHARGPHAEAAHADLHAHLDLRPSANGVATAEAVPATFPSALHRQSLGAQQQFELRREGLPIARLWENKSALLSLGLNKKGKPGLWIVQKIR